MKDRITFSMVVSALDELISKYDENSNEHSRSKCPLCRLFDTAKSLGCKKCLNKPFDSTELTGCANSYTPCAKRCIIFPKLSYVDVAEDKFIGITIIANDQNISKFWKEVKEALINKGLRDNETFIVNRHKKLIIEIAQKYE